MFKGFFRRLNISGIVVLLYLGSIILLSAIPPQNLGTLMVGLLLSSIGSVGTFLLLRQWEMSIREESQNRAMLNPDASKPYPNPFHSNENFQELENALEESQEKKKNLVEELNQKSEIIHTLEKKQKQFEHKFEDIHHEFNACKSNSEEELRRKTVLLSEYQETINQQREVIKKKQEQISEMESKIHDLNYEVKTLLQLAEIDNQTSSKSVEGMIISETMQSYQVSQDAKEGNGSISSHDQVKTPEEASSQLKRCLDIAQKITGANHFGNGTSRFKEIAIDNYALDLRRLFDSLGSENSSTLLVYSQKESRLLYVNNLTKNLLGWSKEKFIQNFPEIIQEGNQEWKKGISQLSSSSEAKVRLLLKTKSGQNLLVHCHLGTIPTGIFRNHVIGILYPA